MHEVFNPTRQRLQARVGRFGSQFGDFVIKQSIAHTFQVRVHRNEPSDRILHILQAGSDYFEEPVEPDQFLSEHSVHRIVVIVGILVVGFIDVEQLRNLFQDHLTGLENGCLFGFSLAGAGPG